MKIVAGLGNPGAQYENTPHSIGFEAVDEIASRTGAQWVEKRAFKALVAKCVLGGEQTMLVKPQTFMNLSGESLAPLVKYSNASAQDLIVIQDDIDLAAGRLRIRKGGSCGGHNGVRNIIERLGSPGFTRIKIGVGKEKENVIGFVLGKFSPEARRMATAAVKAAADAAAAVLAEGADKAMNAYNGWRYTEEEGA